MAGKDFLLIINLANRLGGSLGVILQVGGALALIHTMMVTIFYHVMATGSQLLSVISSLLLLYSNL